MPAATRNHPLRFGRFELQPAERRLLVDGQPVSLGGRAFDLLLALARRPGRLLTKAELLDEVWPGLVVEEGNLAVQISTLRKLLGGEVISTIPGRGYRFVATIESPPGAPPSAPAPPPPGRMPALVGRDDDLDAITKALAATACLTLTGMAGVGKTSLARAVAAQWPGGAVWVDLAPLTASEQLPAALARALDRPFDPADGVAALARALGGRLLVLDNAEHLLDGAGALATALTERVPALHVLVTSQVPLALAHERVRRIEPLALPLDSDALDLHRGAIALFVERAQAADHRFRAEAASLPLLREICRRLDGLPLALEMAAVRVPALGLKGVCGALQRRFALLTGGWRQAPGRHRTLHAALDWSHSLLAPEEQRVLRACGVFAGGFTLELAVDVAADASHDRWDVVDTLARLVDRSLVAADGADPPRYRLLETVRVYALERLAEAGEEAAARRRLAEAMLALNAAAVPAVPAGAPALAEAENAREALAWATAHEPGLALQLAVAICRATTFVTWRAEAARWLDSCAGVVDDARVAPADRATWWSERARQRVMQRDPAARAFAREALAQYRALGDEAGMFDAVIALVRGSVAADADLPQQCDEIQALAARHPEWPALTELKVVGALAHACHLHHDYEGKLAHRLREHALAERFGRHSLAEVAETNIIAALQHLGRHEEALARADALLARIGGSESLNVAYAWLGRINVLVSLRRWEEVRADLPRALPLFRRFELPILTDLFAWMAAHEGRPLAAALLIGHARRAYADAGRSLEPDNLAHLAEAEALVRPLLGDAEFARRVALGQGLDSATAERLAIQPDDAPPEPPCASP